MISTKAEGIRILPMYVFTLESGINNIYVCISLQPQILKLFPNWPWPPHSALESGVTKGLIMIDSEHKGTIPTWSNSNCGI